MARTKKKKRRKGGRTSSARSSGRRSSSRRGSSRSSGRSKGRSKSAEFRNIGSICVSQKGKDYIQVFEGKGSLFFKDKETQKLYRVKIISMGEPHDEAPEWVESSLFLVLSNEDAVERVKKPETRDDDYDERDDDGDYDEEDDY